MVEQTRTPIIIIIRLRSRRLQIFHSLRSCAKEAIASGFKSLSERQQQTFAWNLHPISSNTTTTRDKEQGSYLVSHLIYSKPLFRKFSWFYVQASFSHLHSYPRPNTLTLPLPLDISTHNIFSRLVVKLFSSSPTGVNWCGDAGWYIECIIDNALWEYRDRN